MILQLRVTLLSGLWDQAYAAAVASVDASHIRVYDKKQIDASRTAA